MSAWASASRVNVPSLSISTWKQLTPSLPSKRAEISSSRREPCRARACGRKLFSTTAQAWLSAAAWSAALTFGKTAAPSLAGTPAGRPAAKE